MADFTEEDLKRLQEARKEYERLLDLRQRGKDYDEEKLKALEKQFEGLKRTTTFLKEQVELAEAYLQKLSDIGNSADARTLQLQAAIRLEEASVQLLTQQLEEKDKITEADLLEVQNAEKSLEAKKRVLEAQEELNEKINTTNSLSLQTEKFVMKTVLAGKNMNTAFLSASKSLLSMTQTGVDFFMGNLITNAKEVFFAFNETTTAFEKQFAVGQEYKTQITDLYQELDVYGVTIEDVTKSQGALITSFTDFTLVSGQQRESLTRTANLLQRGFGIAFEDFANGVQASTKALGMSTTQAENFQVELTETAKALGVPVTQLSSQFASLAPSLAKFGSEGGRAFKEVARLSKITGLEMEKVIAVTEQFDTFERAAERTGMLNAALGGNFVNAMDMMMTTDPAERFMMIRDAIDQTGLSFDEMGYYQRQFFAEAAGLGSVNDLALLMSGNMDLLTGATNQNAASIEEQAKRAADMTTIMETLKAAFVDIVGPIVLVEDGIKNLVDSFRENVRIIATLVGVYKGLQITFGIILAIQKLRAANSVIRVTSGTREIAQTNSQTVALERQNGVLTRNIQLKAAQSRTAFGGAGGVASAFGTAATIAAVAAAILALGKSFDLMATGVERLAGAFENLDNEKISGLNTTIGLLGGTLVVFGAGLLIAAKAATAGALGIGVLATGIALIAGSIGIAAAGIGFMAIGLASLYESIDFDKTTSLIALMAAIGVFAYTGSGLAGAASFTALGAGLAITAASLALISDSKLSSISKFTESIASLETGALTNVATAIKTVANAMKEIPENQTTVLEAMVRTTAQSATAIAAVNRTGQLTSQARTAGQPQALATSGNGKLGEIKITFDSALFKDKVVEIYNTEDGLKAIEAAEGRGGSVP